MTTASISVIDKARRDGTWNFFQLSRNGSFSRSQYPTGSENQVLPYENRGCLWAQRGMSPGTQKVFALTEGERIHAGLTHEDVMPCVTSLRDVPADLIRLTVSAFKKRFVQPGLKCWLIKSCADHISKRLRAYLNSVPEHLRRTSTCSSQFPWYRYPLFEVPDLLVSTGFVAFGPKVLINSVGARCLGSVCGIYAPRLYNLSQLRKHLVEIDFEQLVVPHAKRLKKVEIRQLNGVLNAYYSKELHAKQEC